MAKVKAVTYRQLMVALRAMAFRKDRKQSASGYTVLVRPLSDTPIILPVLPAATPMRATHLAMVRRILRESGPEDEERLKRLLHGHEARPSQGVPVS